MAAAIAGRGPLPSGNGTYWVPKMDGDLERAVVDRLIAANEAWWRLDVDQWRAGVKRYLPGERHTPHQDLHPGGARRKLAGSIQLSEPDDYRGGDLVVHFSGRAVPMPRARGALAAFPGWTSHEVRPVTAGERWSFVCFGFGPQLR